MPRGQPEGEEVYRPEVQPEIFPRKITPEMRGAGDVGEAFSRAALEGGGAVAAKYAADSTTTASNALTNFRVSSVQQLEDMKAKAGAGDPGNFTERYLSAFDEKARALDENQEGNPIAQRVVRTGLNNLRATLAEHVMGWEAVQRKASQNTDFENNLNSQLDIVRKHPELQDQVGQTLVTQMNGSANDPATKLKYVQLAHKELTRSAALGLADTQPGDTYRQLMSGAPENRTLADLTDPASRAEVLAHAQAGVATNFAQGVLSTYRAGGPTAGGKAYGAIDGLKFPGTDQEAEAMRDKIREEVKRARGELISEQQAAHGDELLGVQRAIASKNVSAATSAQIWGLYHNNALEPHVAGSMLGEVERIQQQKTDDQAGIATIQDAWNGKVLLDPKDKDQQKDMSTWFDSMVDTNKIATGSQPYVNLAAEVGKRTGMIPESYGRWARSVLVGSNDPDQVMAAVDGVDRVRRAAPRSFTYLDDDHKLSAMADSIGTLTRSGLAPQEAITLARANAARGDKEGERFSEMWKAARPFGAEDQSLADVVTRQVKDDLRLVSDPHWYRSNTVPPIPPQMQAEYAELARSYFQYNGGNVQQAEQLAATRIGNAWGLTRINGDPEIVKYPPERIFPGLSTEDIRSDLESQAEKHPEAFQHWDEEKHALTALHVEPDHLKLAPINDTATTSGRTWGVFYQADPGGPLEALYGKNNRPLTYDMPVSQEDYKKMRNERYQRASEAALKRKAEIEEQERTWNRQLMEDEHSWMGTDELRE